MERDKLYILCEFLNEDATDSVGINRPVREGHTAWLLDEPRVAVSELIEKKCEINLKWPKNHEVSSLEVMRKHSHITWKKNIVAVILAQSDEWTDICDARKNVIKYGVPFPSKKERKELVKIADSKGSTDKLSSELSGKKCKKNHGDSEKKRSKESQKEKFSEYKRLQAVLDYDSESSSDTQPLLAMTQRSKKTITTSDEVFSEPHLSNAPVCSLHDDRIIVLEEENKSLREEIKRYKSMKSIVEGFPALETKVANLAKFCQCEIDKRAGQTDTFPTPVLKPLNLKNNCRSEDDQKTVKKDVLATSADQELVFFDSTSKQPSEVSLAPSTPVIPGSSHEEYVVFGSKLVNLNTINKLRHTKITILASELVSVVFSEEEMALCSMKGKVNYKCKEMGFLKQHIDEERVDAIIDYVCTKKGLERQEVEATIRTSIGNKLGNFRKTDRGKSLLAAYKLKNKAENETTVEH